jgi:Flp pilus assembly protein TadD
VDIKARNRKQSGVWAVTAVALTTLALLTSCAVSTVQQGNGSNPVTAGMVLEQSPLAQAPGAGAVESVDIVAINPEMKAFLEANINRSSGQEARLSQLVRAVVGGETFELVYDDSTRTAMDTFELRHGNCLSFTSMFVAMAREIGLEAHFQEVAIPPDWSMVGGVFLLSKHVNALIELRNKSSRVVDFNNYSFDYFQDGAAISDARARAHYFNNLGAEHMLGGETGLAYANLRQSLLEDATFASAWVNMGILHRREALGAYAEAAFRAALELESWNTLAMSNLASLYAEQGDDERAERYLSEVRSHRMQNPYYRYAAANEALAEGDYETAISHLRYAIRKRGSEDRFYHLLSVTYLMSGDQEQAQKWMKKAEEVARESRDKQRYHYKLQLLMGQGDPLVDPAQSSNASSTGVE